MPDTSRPPCPLVIALEPLKCSSRNLEPTLLKRDVHMVLVQTSLRFVSNPYYLLFGLSAFFLMTGVR